MASTVMLITGAAQAPWPGWLMAETVIELPYARLDVAAVTRHLPDAVVLPLFGDGFDAVDALVRLAQIGFSGPIAVTGPHLPNPAAIVRELGCAAPGMTVTLLGPAGRQLVVPPCPDPESR